MQVPLKWLQEYVDIEGPREELYERITLAGLEVVGIEEIGARWDRDKILVGAVKEIRPHPNADRLTVAVVDYGADEPLAVVTGAPNLKPGDSGVKVAFATEGAMLIDGYATERKYVKLRPSKIRGVASTGMVCSEKELGISDEHEGIMILPADAPVGVPLRDYLGDSVLELDLTNDMAYCTNMAGVGREVAALLGVDYHKPPTQVLAEGEKIAGQVLVENKYIASEQLDDPRHADFRADLYSLGVVWYDMLFHPKPDEFIDRSCRVGQAFHRSRCACPRPAGIQGMAAHIFPGQRSIEDFSIHLLGDGFAQKVQDGGSDIGDVSVEIVDCSADIGARHDQDAIQHMKAGEETAEDRVAFLRKYLLVLCGIPVPEQVPFGLQTYDIRRLVGVGTPVEIIFFKDLLDDLLAGGRVPELLQFLF